MRIKIITYNLAQRQPSKAAIGALLASDHQQAEARAFDVLVVGVEEHMQFLDAMRSSTIHVDTPGKDGIADNIMTPNLRQFFQGIDCELGSQARRIAAIEHGATGIGVWVHAACELSVSVVSLAKVGIGMLAMSNKGAVGVVLSIGTANVAFICAHLAAGVRSTKLRNSNFRDIVSRLLFPGVRGLTLFHCDAAFFLGDLNYRAPPPPPTELSKPDLNSKIYLTELEWYERFEYDQLHLEMMHNRTFPGFAEPAIRFPPTYKLQGRRATTTAGGSDAGPYVSYRDPSWCDRVLYYAKTPLAACLVCSWITPTGSTPTFDSQDDSNCSTDCARDQKHNSPISCLLYSAKDIAGSDHLPVVGNFELDIQLLCNISNLPGSQLPEIANQYWLYSQFYWQCVGVAADRIAGTAYSVLADSTSLCVCIATAAIVFGYLYGA